MDATRKIYIQLLQSPNRTQHCFFHILWFVLDECRVTFLTRLFSLQLPEESSLYQLGQALLHNEDHTELVECIVYHPNQQIHRYLYQLLLESLTSFV